MHSKTKAVAYARVSTLLGQDPEHQLVPIREVAAGRGLDLIGEHVDKGVSGAKESRPALDRLVADARQGRFKVVIIAAIDRLGRNTRALLNLIHQLDQYGVTVISIREAIDFASPLGRAMLALTGIMAQLERDLISERIRIALAVKKEAARKTGRAWRCGRPRRLTPEVEAQVRRLSAQGLSTRAIVGALGGAVRKSTVATVLSKNPIKKAARK